MTVESLNEAVQRLITSMEALAAIGAAIDARGRDLPLDPQVRAGLHDVIHAIDPGLFDGIRPDQEAIVLHTIRAAFRQAADILDDPARAPGWHRVDTALMQSQGQQSRRVVHAIDAFAAQRPALKRTLQEPGAFLDIGTGCGWLAIEAAQSWPALRTVGLDAWDVALELARSNIASAGLDGRIELRRQAVEDLGERESYTLVWFPAPFIAFDIVPAAIERIRAALRPEGWLVFGLFGGGSDPLGQALTRLRTLCCGGYPWSVTEVEDRLRQAGFAQIESSPQGPQTRFVVGQKPVSPVIHGHAKSDAR
jgi:SAM-dependent methyltransferase